MNQFFYNIAKRKRKNIDRMTERKRAQKLLPRVAVHLGKAEWKFTLARLFKPLAPGKTNKHNFPKMSSNNCLWNMVYTLCFLENVPKLFLNIVWSGLKPKDLTITAVGTKTSKFISFCTTAVLERFDEHSGEIILELKQRLAVQLKSRC